MAVGVNVEGVPYVWNLNGELVPYPLPDVSSEGESPDAVQDESLNPDTESTVEDPLQDNTGG